MTKPWISDARQRRSKRYLAVHADLAAYAALKALEPRQVRHQARSNQFWETGEIDDTGDSKAGRRRSVKVQR
jgi:hypothetical protein